MVTGKCHFHIRFSYVQLTYKFGNGHCFLICAHQLMPTHACDIQEANRKLVLWTIKANVHVSNGTFPKAIFFYSELRELVKEVQNYWVIPVLQFDLARVYCIVILLWPSCISSAVAVLLCKMRNLFVAMVLAILISHSTAQQLPCKLWGPLLSRFVLNILFCLPIQSYECWLSMSDCC